MDALDSPDQMIVLPDEFAATGALDVEATDAIAKVNGKPIPRCRLDFVMKSSGAQSQADFTERMERALDMVIGQEVLYQEAVRMGYEKNPDVAMQIEFNKEEVVIDAYLRDCAKSRPIGEDRLKQEYETQKAISGGKEYRVRHIMVDTEEEAQMIVKKLRQGAGFEELAIQHSMDGGSKFRGGDLDWASAAQYVPALRDAIEKLGKGQTTEAPVQADSGWHILRVDDERELSFPAFEDVKLRIYESLHRKAVDEIIAALRAKAKIE
jgi:peptidyl-prolyl cis-trans isomerase C